MCKYTDKEREGAKHLTSTRTSTIIRLQRVLKQVQFAEVCLWFIRYRALHWAVKNPYDQPGGILVKMFRGASRRDGACCAAAKYLLPVLMCAIGALERRDVTMKENISPCVVCNRVIDPENCTDKSCRIWQRWFLQQWEKTRNAVRQLKDMPDSCVGVVVGGMRYAAPNQVQDFLEKDPCDSCLCPKDLCDIPCRKRKAWESCSKEGRG